MSLTEARAGLMRSWVMVEREQTSFQGAFDLGKNQMERLQAGEGPIWLEIWLGGVRGEVYRVGRGMEYSDFSLAQMLVAKRNDLHRKLSIGGQVEVHDLSKSRGLPRYSYVTPDALDPILLEAQMTGALVGFDSRVGDYRARVVLEKALKGETFAKPKKHFSGSFSSNGNGG